MIDFISWIISIVEIVPWIISGASAIAALTFGGEWHIHDKDSINTSFPNFLKILKDIQK